MTPHLLGVSADVGRQVQQRPLRRKVHKISTGHHKRVVVGAGSTSASAAAGRVLLLLLEDDLGAASQRAADRVGTGSPAVHGALMVMKWWG